MENEEFRTRNGYRRQQAGDLTESMEDYLGMLCRLTAARPSVGVNEVAARLHVRPPSASKMLGKLKEAGLASFEKYGQVSLTELGREKGRYLLWRHDVLSRFFRCLNQSGGELRQVELIEHFLDEETVRNLEKLLERLPGEGDGGGRRPPSGEDS